MQVVGAVGSWVLQAREEVVKLESLLSNPCFQSDPIQPSTSPRIAYFDHGDLAFWLDCGRSNYMRIRSARRGFSSSLDILRHC